MNILFNCAEYPPMTSGGIGSVTRIAAEGLAARGHKVVVAGYCPLQPRMEEHCVQNGVQVYRYSLGLRSTKFRKKANELLSLLALDGGLVQKELDYYEARLLNLIREHGIQVLELTDYYKFNDCRCALRHSRFDLPTVLRIHGSVSFVNHFRGKDNATVTENDRCHFSRTDHMLSVSRFSSDCLQTTFPDLNFKSREIIPNMIEDGFLSEDISRKRGKSILFIGKLTEDKGAFATAAAFAEFFRGHRDWTLVMAGSGDPEPLRRAVPEDVRSHMIFRGYCDRSAIKSLIDGCAFGCLPSHFETFGMTALELMARSRAVIFTSRTAGPEIIVDGEDGFLVDPSDTEAIAARMSELAENEARRDEMAARAFAKVKERYRSGAVLDRLETFYNGIL